jgi:serine/threonine-protein kinase
VVVVANHAAGLFIPDGCTMTTPADGSPLSRNEAPTSTGYRATTDGSAQAAERVSIDDLTSRLAQPAKMPERIGGYRITGVLGEGGMGVVYQAVQLSLDRTVALKVVRGDLARKEAFVGRFLREAKVAARIDHPNVVTIYDTGEADGHLYMALQYVPGGDLGTRIKRDGKLNEEEALRIIAGCAKGLIAIHAAGLVHRDIKPSNIFLTSEGTSKIGDLGLARNIINDEKLTFTGDLVGTPSYMAPEQAKGAQDIDHRADIYALGTSLYHLLTGRPPFQGSSPFLIGHQVISEVPQDPRELNRSMSPVVAAIIHHAMHKERASRYQSAEELLVDVELVRSGKLPRFARVTVMDEDRRAQTGSLARVTTLAPEAPAGRSFLPVAVGAGMLVGIAVALAVGLGLAQRGNEAVAPATLPPASFPVANSANATTPLNFPPTPDLPLPIQEAPSREFLAANEPAERPLPTQPKRHVEPIPRPPTPAKVEIAPAQVPTPAVPTPPVVTAPPPPVVVETAVAPPPTKPVEPEPAIPVKLNDDAALRVVREEVVRVPLQGDPVIPPPKEATTPAPTTEPRNNLGPTTPGTPAVAVAPTPVTTPAPPAPTEPVAKTGPSALVETPIDQALAVPVKEPEPPVAAVPTVDTHPAWASANGADRYGAWAELTIGTAVQRFRLCPAGGVQVGSPLNERGRRNDETLHRATIERSYWLADSECTQLFWRTVMGDNPSSTPGEELPVDQVSFQRVQEFLQRAQAKRADVTLRLPSEIEWEAACRAGSRGPYTGGLDLRSLAWYRATAGDRLAAVGARQPNAYGLFDVHGNVWEWCQDAARSYPPDVDGLPVATHAFVFRGGSFADAAEDCRAARRGGNQTGDGAIGVGFRVAITATMR